MSRIDDADDVVEAWADTLRGNPALDKLFYTASEWGDWSKVWHALGVANAVAKRDPMIALRLSAAMGAESAFVNGFLKSLFKRERPEFEGDRPLHLRQPKTSSFPSGHASSAFMAAAMLSKASPKLRPVYYTTAAVVAYSRIHVKIHHATDVVGGAVVGVALGKLADRFWPISN